MSTQLVHTDVLPLEAEQQREELAVADPKMEIPFSCRNPSGCQFGNSCKQMGACMA